MCIRTDAVRGSLERATDLSVDVGTPVPIRSLSDLEARARTWRTETVAMAAVTSTTPTGVPHHAQPAEVRIVVGVRRGVMTRDIRERVCGWL